MNPNKEIHMMIRDVGAKDSAEHMYHLYAPLKDCILTMSRWMFNASLLQRWDICFGRTKEECETRLRLAAKTQKQKNIGDDEALFAEMLNQVMAEGPAVDGREIDLLDQPNYLDLE